MLEYSVLLQLVAVSWLLVSCLMILLWVIHFPLESAAIVDVGWAAGFPIVAVVAYYLGNTDLKSLLVLIMSALWAGRLGGYLFFTRIFRSPEEGRYVALRTKWKKHTGAKFFLFYQFQAVTVVILSVPYFLVAISPDPLHDLEGLHTIEWVGLLIFLAGWAGEAVADFQLQRFKKNRENHGKVCDTGLWNYSRHPNYFFEIVLWVGLGLFAIRAPFGAIALAPALILLYFIFRVTGIPATEEQSLRTKGQAYAEYQRSTSAFIPWFKKSQ